MQVSSSRRMSARFIVAAVTGVLAASGLVATAAAPASAAGCSGYHCDNKGPVSTNCDNGAVHKEKVNLRNAWGIAYVQLIYSPTCKAYWARGHSLNTGSDGAVDGAGYTIKIEKRLISTNKVTFSHSAHVYSNTGFYEWTNMAGRRSGRKIRACMYMSKAHSGDSTWHCTPWHNN